MKSTLSYMAAAVMAMAVPCSAASSSFAGSNSYYLQGMSSDQQDSYVSSLQDYGAKVVRLWITGTSDGCTKSSSTSYVPTYESTIGDYQTATLDAIDAVLVKLHAAGIKAIISPHDANDLPPTGSSTGYNGIDIYGSTYGSSDNFYSSTTAKSQYDARLASILNYASPGFGGTHWSQLSEAILAFDLQNEPMIASPDKAAANDPDDWLCGRAGNMKKIINGSGVKIATGGIGGSDYCCDHEYNIIDKALYCSAIDILSLHGYMATADQWAYFVPSVVGGAQAQGKMVMVEEWGVGTDASDDSIAEQAAVFNDAGVPWLYWMIIPGASVDMSCDGQSSCCKSGLSTNQDEDFEVGTGSSRANFGTLINDANSASGAQDWSGYF